MDYFNTNGTLGVFANSTTVFANDTFIFANNNGNSGHLLKMIPRFYDSATLIVIHDELKNKEFSIIPNSVNVVNDFMLINFDFQFRENASYQLEVFNNENLIYRSKAKAI